MSSSWFELTIFKWSFYKYILTFFYMSVIVYICNSRFRLHWRKFWDFALSYDPSLSPTCDLRKPLFINIELGLNTINGYTVDTIWNIGETGDIYSNPPRSLTSLYQLRDLSVPFITTCWSRQYDFNLVCHPCRDPNLGPWPRSECKYDTLDCLAMDPQTDLND